MDSGQVNYSWSLVAFLDVLGWRNWIERSQLNADVRSSMAIALQNIGLHRDSPIGVSDMALIQDNPFPVISQFSDSIIVSVNLTQGGHSTFDSFFNRVDLLCKHMLQQGFFMRGGIAVGPLFHRRNVAFGPALVEAYRLETIAKYPRILVEISFENSFEEFFTRVEGEQYNTLDILRCRDLHADKQIALLNSVRPHIEQGLQIPDWHVFEKYRWFARYFNRIAGEFGAEQLHVPARLDTRREYLHSELCKAEAKTAVLAETISRLRTEVDKLDTGSAKIDAALRFDKGTRG